jgi:peptide/nickel transport system substrate-binding protein
VYTNQQPETIALFLNTRLPPFNNVDVRRALNYAVDRAAAVRAVGGSTVATATCQIRPPFSPGYRPYCPYTTGPTPEGSWTAPDVAKAKRLIARSGTLGMKIRFWSWSDLPGLGPFAEKLLKSLGYRASMKAFPEPPYFEDIENPHKKAQIGVMEWISDYPAPSGFFNAILTCASFNPDASNANVAEFCDHNVDGQIAQARAEQAANPGAARRDWERVDRETVDQAPWVSLVNARVVDVLAKRVGNYQYTPFGTAGGLLIDQLWVR